MKRLRNTKRILILIFGCGIVISSCATYSYTYNKTSTIKDITYVTSFINGECVTQSYFLLEDSTIVPTPSNFNPCSPDTYVGKSLTYYYTTLEQSTNEMNENYDSDDYSDYICQKKYISSDGKYMLRIYSSNNPAVKTIVVSAEVYNRAQAGQKILKTDIEPYIKSN